MIHDNELNDFTHFLKLKFDADVITSFGSEECFRAYTSGALVTGHREAPGQISVHSTDESLREEILHTWLHPGTR